jgi:spoIIIJ-associated protein
MARSVEKSAKTVEEAIELALNELGLDQEDVDVEIIDSGSKPMLGLIGGHDAVVRVTESVSALRKVSDYLDTLLEASKDSDDSDVKYYIREEEEDGQQVIKVDISGTDVAYLIGKHGDTLYAINTLAGIIANRDAEEYTRVVIDVADYRKHREQTLISMANRAASKVVKFKKPVPMAAMPASERRIIHTALQGNSRVITESEGEEPNRYVVVKPKPYVKVF